MCIRMYRNVLYRFDGLEMGEGVIYSEILQVLRNRTYVLSWGSLCLYPYAYCQQSGPSDHLHVTVHSDWLLPTRYFPQREHSGEPAGALWGKKDKGCWDLTDRAEIVYSHIQQGFAAFEVVVVSVNNLACLNWEIRHDCVRKEEKVSAVVFRESPVIK